MTMVRCAGVLVAVLSGVAAEPAEWGKPVNGVRMALAYIAADGIIEITFENTTGRELLLPLGYETSALRLIATVGGNTEVVAFTGSPGLPRKPGQPPMLVPLLPGSRYVIRRPTYSYHVSRTGESLGKYMLRRPALQAELNPAAEPVTARRTWTGRLTSNVLEVK